MLRCISSPLLTPRAFILPAVHAGRDPRSWRAAVAAASDTSGGWRHVHSVFRGDELGARQHRPPRPHSSEPPAREDRPKATPNEKYSAPVMKPAVEASRGRNSATTGCQRDEPCLLFNGRPVKEGEVAYRDLARCLRNLHNAVTD